MSPHPRTVPSVDELSLEETAPTGPRLDSSLRMQLDLGIQLCQQGNWKDGLRHLGELAAMPEAAGRLPGVFYSYLGYAIARCERRYWEGLTMCRHSVASDLFQPDNHLNLARTYLLRDHRRQAFRTVAAGLRIDPDHPGLIALHRWLGVRSQPVLPFLSRGHLLNRALGRLRHSLQRAP